MMKMSVGQHLQFQKNETINQTNRNYSLEVFQHTGDAWQMDVQNHLWFGLLAINSDEQSAWSVNSTTCILYELNLEWNAVGSVNYSACTLKFALPFRLHKWPVMQNSETNTCRIHCLDMKGS